MFSSVEQQALVGFLGGYWGLTRDAYALDLRQFAAWCQQRQLALFDVEDLRRARSALSGVREIGSYGAQRAQCDRSALVP